MLSIVIPVCNERENLKELAVHLKHEAAFAEIIVVDGGSTDGGPLLAEGFADVVLQTHPGRAVQMNAGADIAQADYLLFLHADTRLPKAFEASFTHWLSTQPVWGFFPVKLSGKHWMFRVIEKAINVRSSITYGASGDQAICVQKRCFDKVGAYEQIPLMEDLSLSKRLSKLCRPKCFQQPVMTSSRRWEQQGMLKTIFLMWHIRLCYHLGVAPEKLASWYRAYGL